MKKRIVFLCAFVILGVLIVVLAEPASAAKCPGPYDKYGEMLDQVACKDLDGNPTGQEKMDCVTQLECCCNTSMQTACDLPSTLP